MPVPGHHIITDTPPADPRLAHLRSAHHGLCLADDERYGMARDRLISLAADALEAAGYPDLAATAAQAMHTIGCDGADLRAVQTEITELLNFELPERRAVRAMAAPNEPAVFVDGHGDVRNRSGGAVMPNVVTKDLLDLASDLSAAEISLQFAKRYLTAAYEGDRDERRARTDALEMLREARRTIDTVTAEVEQA